MLGTIIGQKSVTNGTTGETTNFWLVETEVKIASGKFKGFPITERVKKKEGDSFDIGEEVGLHVEQFDKPRTLSDGSLDPEGGTDTIQFLVLDKIQ